MQTKVTFYLKETEIRAVSGIEDLSIEQYFKVFQYLALYGAFKFEDEDKKRWQEIADQATNHHNKANPLP